jgi:hypothetical protein
MSSTDETQPDYADAHHDNPIIDVPLTDMSYPRAFFGEVDPVHRQKCG